MAGGTAEYCDLVMKGGVTSGVVYPPAIVELAKKYRFKNIGGTSAGAMAAAATAAAALGERRKSQADDRSALSGDMGFSGLAQVAADLTRQGFIDSLFQSVRGGEAGFALATRLGAKQSGGSRALLVLAAILRLAPLAIFLVLAVLLLFAWGLAGVRGIAAALLPALACALMAGLVFAARRLVRLVRGNSLGLCAGLSTDGGRTPGLADWLHATLQSLSGQSGRPLLFDDLWQAPRYPDEPGLNAITLEMITTSVSHNEPRSLPFQGSTFWFRRDQFERLFPAEVVDWMAAQDQAPIMLDGKEYCRLPKGGKLPVVVATRMSLCFPLLISAVPLYERDYRGRKLEPQAGAEGAPEPARSKSMLGMTESLATGGLALEGQAGKLRICWFSDGGISSNFPLHMFDAPMPRWPTFAINLVYPRTDDEGIKEVYLPTRNNEGWQRRYEPIASNSGVAEIAGFLFAIVKTMQNWRDLLQSRASGHRDRIVHVPLFEGEGGLSFGTPEKVLKCIAKRGQRAGEVLIADFRFNNHWWLRWRNCASAVERFTIDFAKATRPEPSPSYADAHKSAWTGSPPAPSYKLDAAQQSEAQLRLKLMTEQGELWIPRAPWDGAWTSAEPQLTRGAPRPRPKLRIVPTF